MKYYGLLVTNVVAFILIFGVMLPMLFSAKSTELVIIGFGVLAGTVPLFWALNKSWIMSVIKKVKQNAE